MASTFSTWSNHALIALQHFPIFHSISITPHLRELRHFPCSVALKNAQNSHTLQIIRARTSTDYIPEANFYKVEAILSLHVLLLNLGFRPWRIPQVSAALLNMGIRGVTDSDVRGFGAQGGFTERQAGSEFSEDNFLSKVKMEIVVCKAQVWAADKVEDVIEKIIEEARTGEIGDGKIFLTPVCDVIRVRTSERGEEAERMMGGQTDMFSA